MSLVTPENVSLRPGWRVTPMGRIVRPMRMRPGKPLPPTSAATRRTPGKEDGKKRRKREKHKLVRARRRTIDPTKWDSLHLKGAFLDSVIVTDDGNNPTAITPPKPETTEVSDLSSSEEEEEEEEETGSSEPESIAEGSPKTANRLSPIVQTNRDTADTDNDFDEEKLRALSLLDSMFGGLEGDQEWCGKETLDSDVDMSELPPVRASPSHPSPSKAVIEEPDFEPTVEGAQKDSESEESSHSAPIPESRNAPASETAQNAGTTKAKLKDLFAPQEEQSTPPLTSYHS